MNILRSKFVGVGGRVAAVVVVAALMAALAVPAGWSKCLASLVTGDCGCCVQVVTPEVDSHSCCAKKQATSETKVSAAHSGCSCQVSTSTTDVAVTIAPSSQDVSPATPQTPAASVALYLGSPIVQPVPHAAGPPGVGPPVYRLVCRIRC